MCSGGSDEGLMEKNILFFVEVASQGPLKTVEI